MRHALLGGLFTAVLFEVAKALFGLYVRLFPGYQLIYGAFATVPLFLLWIYLSWLVVLFGAELVCNLGTSHQWRRRAVPRLLVVMGILRIFHARQQAGLKVRHRDVQRQGWLLPEHEWEEVLEFLEQQHLVAPTSAGAWVLSRDLGHYSLQQLLSRSPWPLPQLSQLPEHLDEPWYPALRGALEKLHEEQAALFGESLAAWLHPSAK
ncbi:YihY family inner membrane protein [compost metagenome]